jgi:hypothetical protein
MGYPVAYLSGNTTTYETGMFKRGTIGQNQAAALTGNYRWWNGIDVTSSQYLIYSDTFTTSASTAANATPAAWATPDLADQSLLNLINTLPERIGKLPFTYLPVALQWIQSTGRYFLLRNGYENIVTNGLKVNLDAGWYLSYSGTGTNWKDLSSNNLNGILTNGPTFSNGVLTFDGTDDNVQLGNANNIITNTSEITVETWVKTNVIETYKKIFTTVSPNSQSIAGIYFSIGPSPYNTYFGVKTNSAMDGATTTTNLSTTEYSHVVGTYNNPFAKLYINGSLMATLNVGGTLGTAGIARISGYDSNNESWNGQIPIFRTYTRELSLSEIQQNFNVQKTRFGLTADTFVTSGLTLNLDAGNIISNPLTGTSWYDTTGNNYDATLKNGPTIVSSGTSSYISFDGTDDNGTLPTKTIPAPNPNDEAKTSTRSVVSYYPIIDNFTIEFVVRPLSTITVRSESTTGTAGTGGQKYLFGTPKDADGTKAAICVSIGTNAIQVFEHGDGHMPCLLSYESTLSSVNHFMIKYVNRKPSLYINGVFIKDGLTSSKSLTSWSSTDVGAGGQYYPGNNCNLFLYRIYNYSFSNSQITQNFNAVKSRYGL